MSYRGGSSKGFYNKGWGGGKGTSQGSGGDYYYGAGAGIAASSWDNPDVSKGKSKRKGSKSKGTATGAYGQQEDWGAGVQGDPEAQWTGRIRSTYQFAKLAMRSAADADGSSLATYLGSAAGGKVSDKTFVSAPHLAEVLTADNCHLLRRPAVGVSEFAGSFRSGAATTPKATAAAAGENPLKELSDMLATAEGKELVEALGNLDTKGNTAPRTEEDLTKAMAVVVAAFAKDSSMPMMTILGKTAILASRLYMMAIHGLEFGALVQNPTKWASEVPSTTSTAKRFTRWTAAPTDRAKMAAALAKLVHEKLLGDQQRSETANNPENVFENWGGDEGGESDAEAALAAAAGAKAPAEHGISSSSGKSSDDGASGDSLTQLAKKKTLKVPRPAERLPLVDTGKKP